MKEKVVLAYSGGLDTTVIIPWLKENFDYEVICVCGNCGQAEELDGLEERALSSGASKLYIEDLTDEFCNDFIMPCVQAHAVYENKYLLGTSMARPVIAKKLVEIARKEGAGNSMTREHTKTVKIGNRIIGGGSPVLIQSMTNTPTQDVKATVAQINRLTEAGCEIVRCTVPDVEA